MRKLSLAFFAASAALVLSGCGGGGSAPTAAVQKQVAKADVLKILQHGLQRGGDLNDTQQAKMAKQNKKIASQRAQKITPEPVGTAFFDEFSGLWAREKPGLVDDYTSPSGWEYFEDEALTIDAGHEYNWVSDPAVMPMTIRYELIFTAGNFDGLHEQLALTFNEDGSASSTGSEAYPGEGNYAFSGSWNDAGIGEWKGRFTYLDGSWEEYEVTQDPSDPNNFREKFVIRHSTGLVYTFNYNEDMSGTGTITGPSDLLPATIAWGQNGEGKITWKDGTTTDIQIFDLLGQKRK